MGEPKPDAFFLQGKNPGDDFAFLAPYRKKIAITPLVDGKATFEAMEVALAGATQTLYLAFWWFNPDMPVQSRAVRRKGFRRWSDLLIAAAKRGVSVRVFLADFDPVLYDHAHRRSWSAYRVLLGRATRIATDRFQVMCVPHEHDVTPSGLTGLLLSRAYAGFAKEFNGRSASRRRSDFKDSPLLWDRFSFSKRTAKISLKPGATLTALPATHHLKLCIVDGDVFTGGVNVSTGYVDTPRHTGKKRWHDAFVRADGDVAIDAERAFVGLWNRSLPNFLKFIKRVNGLGVGFSLPVRATTALTARNRSKATTGAGANAAQVQRTVSEKKSSSPVPTPIRTDIEQGYLRAIATANDLIYIENQYVRATVLADALVKRYKQRKGKLQVIIVVPLFPEEAVGATADPITQHGAFLQHQTLSKLRTELKSDLGLYSVVQRSRGRPRSKVKDSFGSHAIYVHSKLIVVDDRFAAIGSPNANPRGFRMDSELQIAWLGQADARRLRLALWNELLGSPSGMNGWKPGEYVKRWDAIAKRNARVAPRRRSGFVVPHDENLFKGNQIPAVPDEYAGLFDPDPDLDEQTA